jgi:hypothetical protein
MTGALVLPEVMSGMIEASARRASALRTRGVVDRGRAGHDPTCRRRARRRA